MAAKQCPACGLKHPSAATRCECGHRFGQPGANRLAANRVAASRAAASSTLLGGALVTAFGAILVVGGFVRGAEGPTTIWYGPLVVGCVMLFRGWMRRGELPELPRIEPEEAPEREGILATPELWHKVVAQKCATCERKIVAIEDGDLCRTCACPIHHECADDHEAAHGATPYR